jgi:hypothetical protein
MACITLKEKSMAAINNNQPSSNVASIEAANIPKASNNFGDKIARVLNSDAMAATCVALGGALTLAGLALLFVASAPAFVPIVGTFAVAFGLFLLLNGALNFFMSASETSPEPKPESSSDCQPESLWIERNIDEIITEAEQESITGFDDILGGAEGENNHSRTHSGSSYHRFESPSPSPALIPPPPSNPAPIYPSESNENSALESRSSFLFRNK